MTFAVPPAQSRKTEEAARSLLVGPAKSRPTEEAPKSFAAQLTKICPPDDLPVIHELPSSGAHSCNWAVGLRRETESCGALSFVVQGGETKATSRRVGQHATAGFANPYPAARSWNQPARRWTRHGMPSPW